MFPWSLLGPLVASSLLILPGHLSFHPSSNFYFSKTLSSVVPGQAPSLPCALSEPLFELSPWFAELSVDPGWTRLGLLTHNGTLGRSLLCSEP